MRSLRTTKWHRGSVVTIASALALAIALTGPVPVAHATGGAQLWVARYNGPAHYFDAARALAVSPDGATVYATGSSDGVGTRNDYATVAYDSVTGARIWLQRYDAAGLDDSARALAVSPDGATVYVTGVSVSGGTLGDYTTIAYDAVTGAPIWVSRYTAPNGRGLEVPRALAVSPDGATVFVTGVSDDGGTTSADYATVAYDSATGAEIWARRYAGPGNGWDSAEALAVSPDGTSVYVTGLRSTSSPSTGDDYATLAYNAATGATIWVRRYNGPGNGNDAADAIAVSPDGIRLYVTGQSYAGATQDDYATVAYDTATGARVWVSRYSGPGYGDDWANAIAVSPDGFRVFVTGARYKPGTKEDYGTVAYDAVTGAKIWAHRYNGRGNSYDVALAIAASPDSARVYVTGESPGGRTQDDYATVAYDVATGARDWVLRYNGRGNGGDDARAIAVSPDGASVYVTGASRDPMDPNSQYGYDYATIAYRTS